MEITEVKVFPVRDKKLRAFASIVFDASFMVNDIKVIQGKEGLFISMPSRRQKNGRFKDIAHPLNQATRQVLEDRILAEFHRVAEGAEEAEASEPETQAAPRGPAEGRRSDAVKGPVAAESPPAAQRPEESGSRSGAEATPAAPAAVPPAAPAADASESPGGAERSATAEATAEVALGESGEGPPAPDEKSLEEVAEAHLSDSYWTT